MKIEIVENGFFEIKEEESEEVLEEKTEEVEEVPEEPKKNRSDDDEGGGWNYAQKKPVDLYNKKGLDWFNGTSWGNK